ncbi:MAG: PEP/pyruvate-binding domain-containing protein [Bacteroidales bacterium]|nr:PEP/pyruvate-binding domain-containing protein [Bacteroidales bacterium]
MNDNFSAEYLEDDSVFNKNELAVNHISNILKEGNSILETLEKICPILPLDFSVPENISVQIEFASRVLHSHHFRTSSVWLNEAFYMHDEGWCRIKIFHLSEKPFSEDDKATFGLMMSLLRSFYVTPEVSDLVDFGTERLKELAAINSATRLFREKRPLRETFQQLCETIPRAWQYPRHARVKIIYGNQTFTSEHFSETGWYISNNFKTISGERGVIEIFYLKDLPKSEVGPFLNEEVHLLQHLAEMLESFLNGLNDKSMAMMAPTKWEHESLFNARPLLQRFLNNHNYGRDIFHDLMPFNVREVLLVANLYDAFCIESEGTIASHILGEFYQFNISAVPRITGVSTKEEAMEWLQSKHFDLVILMMGVDQTLQLDISRQIRNNYPYIPIFLLLNNNGDIYRFEQSSHKLEAIDDVYVWNGDSKIFFAMIKILEDRVNVENDTKLGLVRVILLVEDSPKYYSRYLPLLYSGIMEQTQRILDEVGGNEMEKMLKLRARPKILHATTYEDAIELFYTYRDNLLCIISDVRFWNHGIMDEKAGFRLVKQVRNLNQDLPIIIQSSDVSNKKSAQLLNAAFIDKNSETLLQDVEDFIITYLGFGDFKFKNHQKEVVAVAHTMMEFEELLKRIPDDILLFHAKRNHFSMWFMARGEVQLARMLQFYRIEDFMTPKEVRKFVLDAMILYRSEQHKGKVIKFEDAHLYDDRNIVSLYSGLFGGKGRGVAFINSLIYNIDFDCFLPNINIRAPHSFVIGSDAFEKFLTTNNLKHLITETVDYEIIRQRFMAAKLPKDLRDRIKKLVKMTRKPLAVRSSGLFEDSQMQPFAGIFETYLIPNSHPLIEKRVQQCEEAIKMVYASVFSKTARDYINAIHYKIEEEKMAVVIQEVVGQQFGDYFYPHISGVAQSHNYYPIGHMEPDDGFARLAVGLGCYVVDGERSYCYCPKYPQIDIYSHEDQICLSQTHFYAVDLTKFELNMEEGEDAGLIKLPIETAKEHGNLNHTASIYNVNNQCFYPGVDMQGKPIVNFQDILKYNYIPLSKTIEVVMDVMKEAMGCSVEIEFAVDMTPDDEGKTTFYLLQIKPLTGNQNDYNVDLSALKKESLLLFAEKVMGNGVINGLTDLIYVDLQNFDKTATLQIAQEIEQLNRKMIDEQRHYLLIGPGRWGSRDRFIGIPVRWSQISNAKVIVETSFDGFPLDPSSGSHFFHNVTSMNVGYFSVQHDSTSEFIRWDVLQKQNLIEETRFCKHIRFQQPFKVKMDGIKQIGMVELPNA